MKRKNKRKKQFIDRPVQGAVLRRILLHAWVFLVVGAGFTLLVQFLANPFQDLRTLQAAFWRSVGPFIVVMLALTPMFIWDTLKLTNRIVGPMWRVRATLRKMNAGDEPIAPIHFREGDFWGDMADELNVLISRLQEIPDDSHPTASINHHRDLEEAIS